MTDARTIEIEKMIADMIGDNDEKAKEVFSLTPDALAAKLDGVSADEIKELGDAIKDALTKFNESDELSADKLDEAAGGAIIVDPIQVAPTDFRGLAVFMTGSNHAFIVPGAPVIRTSYTVQIRRNVSLLAW